MKKNTQNLFGFIVLLVFLSCNGQQKTAPAEVSKEQAKKVSANEEDVDPYFTESETITSNYGPTSITRNILQDKKGNIWFASWEGIIRYDGKTFTNFTNKEKLRRFHVFSLLEDSKGNIWFGTIGAGIYRYDGKSFTNFTTKDGLVHDSIGCFMEDENGLLWIGTMNGISTYDGITFSNFTIEGGQNNNDINSIVEDQTGKLWIGTRGQAYSFDGKNFTKITTSNGEVFTNVRSITKDSKGTIWLGGNNGLWSYNGTTFTNFSKNFTGYIFQDSQENIWTSSASDGNSRNWALTKYDRRSLATPFEIMNEEGMVFGITEDKEGGIWIGTLKGVYRYDGTNFKDYSPPIVPFK